MEFVVETSDDGRLKAVEVSGPNGQPVMVRSTRDRQSSPPNSSLPVPLSD